MKATKTLFVSLLVILLLSTSFAALIKPVHADGVTPITLPYTITQPGNYQISAPWTETNTQHESITGNDFYTGLIIQASNVVVDGMNKLLTGDSSDIVIIVAASQSNVLLKNINETNGLYGYGAEFVRNITIQASTFNFNSYDGLYGNNTNQFTVKDSTLNNNEYAIDLLFSSNITVQNCTIKNNELGLYGYYADNSNVTGNIFSRNGLTKGAWYGAVEFDDSNCTVTKNTFDNNYDALMWDTEDTEPNCVESYSNNIFHGNAYTFYFNYSSEWDNQQLYFFNNLVNDTANVDPQGGYQPDSYELYLDTAIQSGTRIYSTGLLGGNFWANPAGTGYSQAGIDANNNGFIDTPFDVFSDESVFDYLPYSPSFAAVAPGPITLPCIITQSGNYQISSAWVENHNQTGVFRQGGQGFETGLIIAASNVVIDGANKLLTGNLNDAPVIVTQNNSNITLANIRVLLGLTGITVLNSTGVTIQNCNLNRNILDFCASHSNNLTVNSTTLNTCLAGAVTLGCQNFTLQNSKVNGTILGIVVSRFDNSTNFAVQNCNVTNSEFGLVAREASNFSLQNCSFNRVLAAVVNSACSNYTIRNCDFNASEFGIVNAQSSDFAIKDCNFNSTILGIEAGASGGVGVPQVSVPIVSAIIPATPPQELSYAHGFSVQNCQFNNSLLGMAIENSGNFTIQSCTLNNCLAEGIALVGCSNFTVKDSAVNNSNVGIDLSSYYGLGALGVLPQTAEPENSGAFTITNCNITNTFGGLTTDEAFNFTVSNCHISNSVYSMELFGVNNATIRGNNFSNNRFTGDGGDVAFGIAVVDSNCTISNNLFFNNTDGLLWAAWYPTQSATVVASNNIFQNNNYTFVIDYELNNTCTSQKLFFYNNLVNDSAYIDPIGYTWWDNSTLQNGLPAGIINLNTTVQPGTRIYSNGSMIGGNYWTYCNGTAGFSQTGTDANHDGFVDTSFDLFGNKTALDNHPYSNGYQTRFAFIGGTNQSLVANQPSAAITVQLQDAFGNATSGVIVNLSASSGTGKFYNNSACTQQITSVAIPAGSSSAVFYYKDTAAGTPTLTASSSGVNSTATQFTLSAHAATAVSVAITPAISNVTAGATKTFTATASDAYSNSWDVTSSTTFSIQTGAGGSWSANVYTSAKAGTWTVTGTYASSPYTTSLTVNHASVANVVITPAASSVAADSTKTFSATANDAYSNTWDVTSSTTWTIQTGAGGSWNSSVYTPANTGTWTVTGTYASAPYTTTLTVYPGELDHFVVSAPSTATATLPFNITVTAKDAQGNTITDFNKATTLGVSYGLISPANTGTSGWTNGVWTGSVTLGFPGSITISATDGNDHSGTSNTITVSAAPTPTSSPTSTPTATPTPTPSATPTSTPTSNSTITATTENGTTEITISSGNITSAQVTSAVITTNQSAATTTLSFTLTGESGTVGFSNMTIPKSSIPYGTSPIVFIDGQQAADQGFTEDSQNYYVWFSTHFSTHQVEISFTGQTPQQLPWVTIAIAVAAIAAVIGVLLVAMQKRKGKNHAAKQQPTTAA